MSMEIKRFNEIDLNDCFFDSLKEDYPGLTLGIIKRQQQKKPLSFRKIAQGIFKDSCI